MRKIKRNRKKLGMKGLIFAFLITLIFIGTGYSLLSQNLQIKGTTTIVKQIEEEKIKFTYVKNAWGADPYISQFDITLENVSQETFSNWRFYISVPSGTQVIAAWGVKASIQNGKLVLENESYNANIGIDAKLSFGIQLSTLEPNFELQNPFFESGSNVTSFQEKLPEVGTLNVEYNLSQNWQDGLGYHYSYEARITNSGNSEVNNWRLEINKDSDLSLESAWSTNYVEQQNQIVFTNVDYNGTIAPNATIAFNFVVLSSNSNYKPTTISVSGTK